jgi:hypothetical protein
MEFVYSMEKFNQSENQVFEKTTSKIAILEMKKKKKFKFFFSFCIDVVNPLEPDLNVSSNVKDSSLRKFQTECMVAHMFLKSMLIESSKHNLFSFFDGSLSNVPRTSFRVEKLFDNKVKKPSKIETSKTDADYFEEKRLEKEKKRSRTLKKSNNVFNAKF